MISFLGDDIPIAAMRSITAAIEYRSPAKIKGGISSNPNFMMINEDDHRIVTKNAVATANQWVRSILLFGCEEVSVADTVLPPNNCEPNTVLMI